MSGSSLVNLLALTLMVPSSMAAVRSGVRVVGPTVPPGFSREEGKLSTPCPSTHCYPFNNHSQCCSSKRRGDNDTCPNDGADNWLRGRDPESCCLPGNTSTCASPPCKMCADGFLGAPLTTIHALLVGRLGTYTWNFESENRILPDPTKNSPVKELYNDLHFPAGAAEYPRASGEVVLCGGKTDLSQPNIRTECSKYNFHTDTWDDFPSLLHETAVSFMFTTDDGTLWVAAGYDDARTLDVTEYFDTVDNTWNYGPPLPEAFGFFGAAHLSGDEIVLAGGQDITDTQGSKRVFVVNVVTGNCQRKQELPSALSRFALGKMLLDPSDENTLALVATASLSNDDPHDVYIYTFANDTWTWKDEWDIPAETSRYVDMYNMVNVGNKLYLFGGNYHGTFNRDVWQFNGPDAQPVWTLVGNMAQEDSIDTAALVTVTQI